MNSLNGIELSFSEMPPSQHKTARLLFVAKAVLLYTAITIQIVSFLFYI